jgi:hypothetical protein
MILFKKIKIELWVLCLAGVLLFIGMIGFGSLVRHEILAQNSDGVSRFPILSSTALFIAEIPANTKKISKGEMKESSPLRAVEQRFLGISGFQGEPLKDETYLLLSKYDGDSERAVVELVDLRSFEVKKTWRPDITQINDLVDTSFPEFQTLEKEYNAKRYLITHPFLTEDGGLIFQGSCTPLVKIDKNSQLVWQNQEDCFHHSIEQDHEGNFWIPSNVHPYQIDKRYVGTEYGYLDDAITKVSADGEILFQKSVSNILIENNLKFLLSPFTDNDFFRDPIHLNDIQPVLTDGPHWKRGDLFLSLRTPSMIILYRPSTNKIIWKGTWYISLQHDVNIVDDHRISIFNNNEMPDFDGKKVGDKKVDGNNEVVIYDFKTDSYSKYLDESLEQYDVRTFSQGRSHILDNDDLFIEDQNHGRILYFNNDASLQWQYVNRADNGDVYLVRWSRILYKPEDIKKVRKILEIEN